MWQRSRRPARALREPERPRSDTTPMIDVTFLLLVFFMLTIQFKTLEGLIGASLPKDVGSDVLADRREDVDLRIEVLAQGTRLAPDGRGAWSGAGPFRYGPDRLVRWSVGPWSTPEAAALTARLETVRRHEPDRRVVIDAGPGTNHGEAVTALDAARLAGWTEVAFAAAR